MIALLLVAAAISLPQAAPANYVTRNYNLRFRSPAGAFICPLSPDWVGSDHGTVLFLVRPAECGGVGYASSVRGAIPAVPRIEVYYGYALDDQAGSARCRGDEHLRLLRLIRIVCRVEVGDTIRLEAVAGYPADSEAELHLSLSTTPTRLAADLETFKKFAATVENCSTTYTDSRDGTRHVAGSGRACPRGEWW